MTFSRSLLPFALAGLVAAAAPFAHGASAAAQGSAHAAPSPEATARARTLFEQGQTAYAAGRFDEAVARMREAYELTRAPELAFNVARVYERMSDYRNAIRYFELYLHDGHPAAEERAQIEQRIAAIRAADQRRRQQVFTAPASNDEMAQEARTFFERGVALYRRRQYQAAMEAFIAAHRFAPLPEVLYNMAVTAERLGSTQDAIDYYREYLRVRPDGPERGQVEREIERLRASR